MKNNNSNKSENSSILKSKGFKTYYDYNEG